MKTITIPGAANRLPLMTTVVCVTRDRYVNNKRRTTALLFWLGSVYMR